MPRLRNIPVKSTGQKLNAAEVNGLQDDVLNIGDTADAAQASVANHEDRLVTLARAMDLVVVTSSNPPAQDTSTRILTIVPGDAFYIGPFRVGPTFAAAANVAPTFNAGAVTLTGNNGSPLKAGDIVTVTHPAATGTPSPSISYEYYFDGTIISGLISASTFTVPEGSGGKVLTVVVRATNAAGEATLTSAGSTIQLPAETFPSWTAGWWSQTELGTSPYGRLQFTFTASVSLDAAYDYYVTTSNSDSYPLSTDLATVKTASNKITGPSTTNTRVGKAAGTVVYPKIIAVSKASGNYQTIATMSPITIVAGGGAADYAITHTATASDVASSASFTAWVNGLPDGAVGGIPGGNLGTITCSVSNTKRATPIRLRPVNRDNPPVFTGRAFNTTARAASGLILDGLVFDGTSTLDSRGYPTTVALQLLFDINGYLEIVNCKFLNLYCGACPRGNVKIHRCRFEGINIDAIRMWWGGTNVYIGHNQFVKPKRDTADTQHADSCQLANNEGDATRQYGTFTFEYNHMQYDNALIYHHGLLGHNEKLTGHRVTADPTSWYGDGIYRGNYICVGHQHALAWDGFQTMLIEGNYIELCPGAGGTAGTGTCYPCISAIQTDAQYYGTTIIRNNVTPFKTHRDNNYRPPASRTTYENNQEDNYNKATGLNGPKRPTGWTMPDAGPYTVG